MKPTSIKEFVEPASGFEPLTCALRVRCSTTELRRLAGKSMISKCPSAREAPFRNSVQAKLDPPRSKRGRTNPLKVHRVRGANIAARLGTAAGTR